MSDLIGIIGIVVTLASIVVTVKGMSSSNNIVHENKRKPQKNRSFFFPVMLGTATIVWFLFFAH